MENILVLVHNVLCVAAILTGVLVLFDLMLRCFSRSRVALFLRCSLGSNIAALFFGFHDILPAQKVAMAAVYGAGLAILAWQKFNLQGVWRCAFAFSLGIVLYLNVLALSIQMFGRKGFIFAMGSGLFRNTQLVPMAGFLMLSIVAAMRFGGLSLPHALLSKTPHLKRDSSQHHAVR